MAKFNSWDSYFYPETFNAASGTGTMRNLFGERDPGQLRSLEYTETSGRAFDISTGAVDIARTFDADHLKSIHQYIFQDVYEWAGEFRTVDIRKGMTSFAGVHDGGLDSRLSAVKAQVAGADWANMDRKTFVESASSVFAELNQAHPFREGNGRTSKIFMEHVAEQSRFDLNWNAVPPQVWNQASEFSGPDLGAMKTHPEELHAVFNAVAVERPAPVRSLDERAAKPTVEAKKELGAKDTTRKKLSERISERTEKKTRDAESKVMPKAPKIDRGGRSR